MNQLLNRLCECCGILPEFRDIWGRSHVAAEATQRALLAAMGVAADTEAEVAESLRAFEQHQWRQVLPPVLVLRQVSKPYRIELALPEAAYWATTGARLAWSLQHESGAVDQGEFSLAELEALGRQVFDDGAYVRYALRLDLTLETGYHRFAIDTAANESTSNEQASMSLIIAPATCYQPPAIQGDGRVWGFAAQLYAIRSEHNWGIGDFGDLRRMLEFCAEAGAASLLLNPLHALFPDAPEHASPYSPSSRAWINTIYLELPALADFAECEAARTAVHAAEFQARLRALRTAAQVDYVGVAAVKTQILQLLYAHFREHHLARGSERARAFRSFQAEHGDGLRKQALFEALQAHFRAEDAAIWGWPVWPEAYRMPDSAAVVAFCAEQIEAVEYFEYQQWQASIQLAAAGTRSWELGLGIGIMLDLAIGVAEGGAATWARRELYALAASTGAPPDEINRQGQDWGLPPWIPHRLTDSAYAPFIELLRANMRDAGALRLDHVMGLFRLYWVARGVKSEEGMPAAAYVTYPFNDLLGILALESQRNRCLVVGEDLGTVPDAVRETLHPLGVLSTRLLYFEREQDGRLTTPQAYPVDAVTAVTSHDLPTLAGFWQGLDIDLRASMQLFSDVEVRNHQIVQRAEDRAQLLLALENEGVLPPGSGLQTVAFPEMSAALAAAVYAYLAHAPSRLLLVQLEDAFGVREQPNLPGSVAPAYPCWRLKLPLNLEEWRTSEWLRGVVEPLRKTRPSRHLPGPAGIDQRVAGARNGGPSLRIPRATYRLQLHRDFNLRQVTRLLPYLDALGISDCYLSPLLKARAGSRHGYDITDHSSLNPEIADAEDFEQYAATLKRQGMGQIMDVVPNHMGVMGADNGWWLDVLENGQASRFAGYFDIDWHPLTGDLDGRVLLPVLGDHYGAVLEQGELELRFDAEQGSFSVFYYQHRFPLDPREYPRILAHELERLAARIGAQAEVLLEFQSLITAFGHLPARDDVAAGAVAERARDKELHKRHLATLCAENADIAQFVRENVVAFNGAPLAGGQGGIDFDLLHALLQTQAWRLAFWRVAADEINYRRFFDINDLAALRMDDAAVFEATHVLVRELIARGYVSGLRIDHPDGLYDPKTYFDRVQAMATSAWLGNATAAQPAAQPNQKTVYLVVEKILAAHEQLPKKWAVHGSTGYDFAALCCGLFVDRDTEAHFTRVYQRFIRARLDLDAMLRANKHLIMETALAGELQVLAWQLTQLARRSRRTRDFSFNSLRGALAEIVASFPVYRTYVAADVPNAAPTDARYVDWAVALAKKHSQAADPSVFDFVHEVLLARHGEGRSDDYRQAALAVAMKFQQYSSPVMAKAVEDTTFYQYNRLLCLNEVGGDPHRFGVSVAAFHHANRQRARHWPHAMLTSSTHDSKRSEDVRARLCVLSEMPQAWRQALARWSRMNNSRRRDLGDAHAPSRNDEYLLYQTLIGIWPMQPLEDDTLPEVSERVVAYLLKAVREAKLRSSWINPNEAYETGLREFAQVLLTSVGNPSGNTLANPFLADFIEFQRPIARLGAYTSLAQLLLKLTSPGVPDIYQGNELWDFSLVDPDNRRPVDYARRRAALDAIKTRYAERGATACAAEWLQDYQTGWIKLYLTWKTLDLRRRHAALLRDGDYSALKVEGARAAHVCAYARQNHGETLLVIVPRLFGKLAGKPEGPPLGEAGWADTRVVLTASLWRNSQQNSHQTEWCEVLTDRMIQLTEQELETGLDLKKVLDVMPFALLLAPATDSGK
jgi:(1->4)-alpha-D-glucan 1-alpha-D-glucosylmutase